MVRKLRNVAGQPAPWVGPEIGVVGHAGGDRRMGELEQERPGSGAQQQHRLAVEPPRFRVRAVQPGIRRARGDGATGRAGRVDAGIIRPAGVRVSIGARYRTRMEGRPG